MSQGETAKQQSRRSAATAIISRGGGYLPDGFSLDVASTKAGSGFRCADHLALTGFCVDHRPD